MIDFMYFLSPSALVFGSDTNVVHSVKRPFLKGIKYLKKGVLAKTGDPVKMGVVVSNVLCTKLTYSWQRGLIPPLSICPPVYLLIRI